MEKILEQINNYYRNCNDFIDRNPNAEIMEIISNSIQNKAELLEELRKLDAITIKPEDKKFLCEAFNYFSSHERNAMLITGLISPCDLDKVHEKAKDENNKKMDIFSNPFSARTYLDNFDNSVLKMFNERGLDEDCNDREISYNNLNLVKTTTFALKK